MSSDVSTSIVKHAPVHYWSDYLDNEQAALLLAELETIDTDIHSYNDTMLNRKTAVLSVDHNKHASNLPTIWGDGVHVAAFPPLTNKLRLRLCKQFDCDFNICLVNVYETGKNTIGWHADNEEKGDVNCIASVSLGSERRFSMLYKKPSDAGDDEKEKVTLTLESGSLLVMMHPCQEKYLHCVLPDKSVKEKRINLTFRRFHYDDYDDRNPTNPTNSETPETVVN
jgi:alkylated DNA repair dioxygenase AlkB